MSKNHIKYVLLALLVVSMLSACQTASSTPEPTMTRTVQPTKEITVTNTYTTTATISPSPTVTLTHTPEPTFTPTPYPTFIVEDVVTATPAQPAVCPVEDSSLVLNSDDYIVSDFYIPQSALTLMLSKGASFSQIKQFYNDAGYGDEIIVKDMTNDGVDELIYSVENQFGIVSCEAGKYTNIFEANGLCFINVVSVEDMNLNGIPDLAFSYSPDYCRGGLVFDVYEWNGQTMEQMEDAYHGDVDNLEYLYYGEVDNQNTRLLRALFFNAAFLGPEAEMLGVAKMDVVDLDHNGTKEIRIKDSDTRAYLSYWIDEPLRELEVIFEWNGEKYLFSNITFSAPEFRFQAVQDADRYFLFRQYDEALAMYDEVINNTTLKPWSEEYMDYLESIEDAQNPDAIAKPVVTLDEYQQLSAYARYRVMMIQLAQGKQTEALHTYQLLDQIYTEDNPGDAYAEIGRTYWNAVEGGQTLVEACQPVVDYLLENPDLVDVLGDSLHGQQSHYYRVIDLCPLDETDVALLGDN